MSDLERSSFSGREVRPMNYTSKEDKKNLARNYRSLEKIGICLDGNSNNVAEMAKWWGKSYGMDADFVAPLTTPSIPTPIQQLQTWLPGFVNIVTAPRLIDELVGISTQGNWFDEEIVQGVMERTGTAVPYSDDTNIPLSSWNVNYERRTIVRLEEGMTQGVLEEQRAAAIRANSADFKRQAAAVSLEIERNRIGFYGFNNGANRTYGFLNDPSLPDYVNVPAGIWLTASYLKIVQDMNIALQQLTTQSQGLVDTDRDMITLALPTNRKNSLATSTDYGYSVRKWLEENYKNVRTIFIPELNEANGSANVFYVYAESVTDSGSDDSRTFIQVVPMKFMTTGVEQRAKGYVEDYTNATAGIMLKRPYAVVRFSGI